MEFALWCLVIGLLLVVMALGGSVLKRLPLTPSIFYLAVGYGLGPAGAAMIQLDPIVHAGLLERLTEIAVLISLFTVGLKLRTNLAERRWLLPLRLAFLSMTITVGLIAVTGVLLLGLSWGAAILLGAILAPTDPVLASDVQVTDAFDSSRLRFSLTGEGGLNDGTAFPFVMLGLGLLGLHELGPNGWRWLAVDVVWATLAGVGIGGLLGFLVGHFVLYLRRHHREGVGLDDFLALGLIALSYGIAILCQAYGFLAVFAAGVGLRRVEMLASGPRPPEEVRAMGERGGKETATDQQAAPAYMAEAVLAFNEQLDRVMEVAIVVLIGGMLGAITFSVDMLWFLPLLFLVIRPIAVFLGLAGSDTLLLQRGFIAWFGIRGIGSLYYLMFAIQKGVPSGLAQELVSWTLTVVAVSIGVHGISVTPLMDQYQKKRQNPTKGPARQE